ncbi:DUF4386 domain-containing protein [Sphingomonas sp.]|uniref:DUF4386 domain-containing protein n=1 Tax=Sphingomonas sp. TaxID=28214 RepID=UPI001EB46295|nr:DUF4386 domain-containing protein [Sphingomonas sp.]MBX3594497.1 DUF4386 domain-containing protein [Sphingomonas sp.]
MMSQKWTGRVAGLLYLIVVITGIVSLAYVPSRLMVRNDTAASIANILANEQLFRIGIAAGLICYTAFLLLPLVLHRLLAPAGRAAAAAMVALALASVPLSLWNMHARLDLLSLLKRPEYGLSGGQLQMQARMLLDSYSNGILIVELFWGLWLLPLGYLMIRSRAIPRVLGAFLMLGCAGYLVDVFATLLVPGFDAMSFAPYVTTPAAIGEIGTCLWLLVMGARNVDGKSTSE